MFRIQVPINRFSDLPSLIDLDGDEFYLGFLPPGAFYMEQSISRRPGVDANPTDLSWTAQQIKLIKKAGKKVFAAFNEHFYPKKWENKIISAIAWLKSQGIDGIIIADPGFLQVVKKHFKDITFIASTGLEAANSLSVRFLHSLGFKRIILPRQLTISEIRHIVEENKEVEFEIFIKNDKCPNRDGFCSFVHGTHNKFIFGQACRQLYLPEGKPPPFAELACGACSLFDIKQIHRKKLQSEFDEVEIHQKQLQSEFDEVEIHQKQLQSEFDEVEIHRKKLQSEFDEVEMSSTSLKSNCSFKKVNHIILKIAGRDKSGEQIQKDLFFLKKAIHYLSMYHTRDMYCNKIRELYQTTYYHECPGDCYYS